MLGKAAVDVVRKFQKFSRHTYRAHRVIALAIAQFSCCLFAGMSQDNATPTFHLHDAVYLYLLTVNKTLAEGNSDYRNGRLIRNMTTEQRFSGKCNGI